MTFATTLIARSVFVCYDFLLLAFTIRVMMTSSSSRSASTFASRVRRFASIRICVMCRLCFLFRVCELIALMLSSKSIDELDRGHMMRCICKLHDIKCTLLHCKRDNDVLVFLQYTSDYCIDESFVVDASVAHSR